jgi:hypothetical protein
MAGENELFGVTREQQLIAVGLLVAVLVVGSYVPPVAGSSSDVTVFAIGLVMVLYAVVTAAWDVVRGGT